MPMPKLKRIQIVAVLTANRLYEKHGPHSFALTNIDSAILAALLESGLILPPTFPEQTSDTQYRLSADFIIAQQRSN